MLAILQRLMGGTLRRQLSLGTALIVASLVALFVWNMALRQRDAELVQSSEQALSLAHSVAVSSAQWVATRDLAGLQEIVQGVARYPDLRHAMVLDLRGQVLAHSDPARLGQFLSDLPALAQTKVLQSSAHLIDVASPVLLGDRHLGWVRVGLGRDSMNTELSAMTRRGLVFGLVAVALAVLLAALGGRYLTRRLYAIRSVADAVQAGAVQARVVLSGTDEAAQLAQRFNHMLDTLAQREAALQQSTELFRAVFDSAAVGIARVDIDGAFLEINQEFCRIIGYPRDEVIGQGFTFQQITLAQDLAPDLANVQRLLCGVADSYSMEKRYVHRDGGIVWVELSVQLLRDALGAPLYFVSAVQDITQRRQAEADLRIAATAFQSHEGIFITNLQSQILRVNRAFSAITGYSAEEAIGQTPRLFKSGRHDAGFYAALWRSVALTEQWQGEIWNRRKNGEVYPEWLTVTAVPDETGKTSHYVASFTDISARKSAEEQIKTLAFFDPLTRLPNRRLLMDRLEQALVSGARHQRKGALLFVDLDNFKGINDTLGHFQGDLLLQQVALRLSASVREGDTVARLGGDEFVVMLEDLSEIELEAAHQAEAVGTKVLAALNLPYALESCQYRSTPSIGVTLFGLDPQEGLEEPLKRADLAMYQAKAAGRNTLRFFDPQMQAVVSARAALEAGLREALAQHQLVLHYQAQVAGVGLVIGAEALVRWQHPQRGLIPPADFIPLAEDTGLILPLGQWVLDSACAQLALWSLRPGLAQLTVAVNVSARQFHQADFVPQVLASLERSGARPQQLKLELTESLLVSNVDEVIEKMNALKAHGVGFSLDDFGTGYSSLSYLKRLPLDQLKIDQGFVRDILHEPNDAAIARMVIALADTLGLAVIAEGVETPAQREFLAAQGCHHYQGYLFSRPLPLADFERFMARGLAGWQGMGELAIL